MSDSVQHNPPGDDSSQDPAQPAVGPAVQFHKLVVPDGQIDPLATPAPPGELIDERRTELDRESQK